MYSGVYFEQMLGVGSRAILVAKSPIINSRCLHRMEGMLELLLIL